MAATACTEHVGRSREEKGRVVEVTELLPLNQIPFGVFIKNGSSDDIHCAEFHPTKYVKSYFMHKRAHPTFSRGSKGE